MSPTPRIEQRIYRRGQEAHFEIAPGKCFTTFLIFQHLLDEVASSLNVLSIIVLAHGYPPFTSSHQSFARLSASSISPLLLSFVFLNAYIQWTSERPLGNRAMTR